MIEAVTNAYLNPTEDTANGQQSDIVICYITYDWGGAAQFVAMVERQNKTVINLA